MATKKPEQSLADYVTIALSPLLIMALVGSLVFFLLEILYVGQFPERMTWTLYASQRLHGSSAGCCYSWSHPG